MNAHRLQAACQATLNLTFALPQLTVTVEDDDDDGDKCDNRGGNHNSNNQLVPWEQVQQSQPSSFSSQPQPQPLLIDDDDDRDARNNDNGNESQASQLSNCTTVAALSLVIADAPILDSGFGSGGNAGGGDGSSGSVNPTDLDSASASLTLSLSLDSVEPQSQQQSQQTAATGVLRRHRQLQRPRQLLGSDTGTKTAVVAATTKREQLLHMEHHKLAQLCLKQQNRLESISATRATYVKQNAKLKRTVARLEKEVSTLKDLSNQSFAICKLGKQADGRGARFSTSSWFSIGLRKCLTQIAATDFGLTAMVDISGQTVMRCEQKTGAALVFAFRLFMAEALESIAAIADATLRPMRKVEIILHGLANADAVDGLPIPILVDDKAGPTAGHDVDEAEAAADATGSQQVVPLTGPWSLLAVGFTNDATTSNIWRRRKLNICEVEVLWVQNFDALRTGDFGRAVARRRCTFLGNSTGPLNVHIFHLFYIS